MGGGVTEVYLDKMKTELGFELTRGRMCVYGTGFGVG